MIPTLALRLSAIRIKAELALATLYNNWLTYGNAFSASF